MALLIIRKLFYACLSLVVVMTFTFLLMKMIPGDPFQQEQALPSEIHQALRSHYGLNDSFLKQYGRYLKQATTFNFGSSLVHKGQSVSQIIRTSFPNSALLGGEALALSIPLGLLFGIAAALKPKKAQGSLITCLAVLGISVPSFILATLLQYILGIKLGLFPIARWGSMMHSFLPALSLGFMPMAFIARLTRTKMIEELHQGYVTTARAKGIPEISIIAFHALRNILSPLFSFLGPLTASILTGSFIVEKIFSIPGLGYWFVSSVLNRDYPLIMGITVFYCAILLLTSLIADIACLFVNPRLTAAALQEREKS